MNSYLISISYSEVDLIDWNKRLTILLDSLNEISEIEIIDNGYHLFPNFVSGINGIFNGKAFQLFSDVPGEIVITGLRPTLAEKLEMIIKLSWNSP